eukprot:TRINITY_DN2402_c0_g1_i1.p1 TRINITY_DN2402_c0_g1~~TRINITY_DN2402_c0_g1_i1.p1  ORF type:complete len:503 (-),score=209.72 TRINITY_DN2402_c0_g1_i1:44-1552(-)
MDKIQFADRAACDAALKDVRLDATPTNWAIFGYQPGSKNIIVFQTSGTGDIEELKGHLKEDEIQYALLRVTDQIDNSVTVKFVFIIWVGERVKINQKALITTQKGEITTWRGQAHIDIYASTLDELSEMMQKVTDASGSSSRVLDESGQKKAASATAAAPKANPKTGTSGFALENEEAIKQAIRDVRSNDHELKWVLLSYLGNSNTVGLTGSGSGGLSEMVSLLEPTGVSYGLLRVEDVVDQSKTIKFVLINWTGEEVPTVRQGRLGTNKGVLLSLIGQYHNDFVANNLNELSEEVIMQKVKDASGSGNRVKESTTTSTTTHHYAPTPAAAQPKPTTTTRTNTSSAPAKPLGTVKTVANCQIANEADGKAAIARVRKDDDETTWALFGYDAPNSNNIVLVSTGSGGLDELRSHFDTSSINYAFYRTSDVYEGHVTVKFVLILWIGDDVSAVRKARIATHKGTITEFMGQYHVDFTAANQGEISEELIKKKIQDASGSAVHVK